MKLSFFSIVLLLPIASSCSNGHVPNNKMIDEENPKHTIFNENCITCHSFTNPSVNRITFKYLSEIPYDSTGYIYGKAIANPNHSNIQKRYFDSMINK
ncbi:MAG: hypothetical protein EOP51_11635 [Sphingobacteriales bacterium]|nr:MAG: hypothetical protein EOP51_11635 [Sphingobacteriales bacterium]